MNNTDKRYTTVQSVGKSCVGCRSCEQKCPKNCISIMPDKEGFLYPVIDNDKCIGCKVCVNSCPAVNMPQKRQPISVYALKNKDKKRILSSASGGASDVFAGYVIDNGGVVYGCAYDADMLVKHIELTDKESLKRIQSSKYVQSDIGSCYSKAKEKLDSGKMVLFTGTPCQIAGLYAFLGNKEYDKLYTVDLICHGVPSPLLFKKYLAYQEDKLKEKIVSFDFRSKEKRGWATQYLLKTQNKSKSRALKLDRYGKHFMDGDCYRESCYTCPYSDIKRVSDITVGDFWGIDKSHPEFSSALGVSSVLVNTKKGQILSDSISKYADITKATVKEAMVKQANLKSATLRPAARDTFYKEIQDRDYINKLKVGLCLKERIKALMPASVISYLKKIM